MPKKLKKGHQNILKDKRLDEIKITISKDNNNWSRTDYSRLGDLRTYQIDNPLKSDGTLQLFKNDFPEVIKWNKTENKLKSHFSKLEKKKIIKFAKNDNVLNHFCNKDGIRFSYGKFKKIKWKVPQIYFLDFINCLINEKLIHPEYKTKKYKLFEPHFSGINFEGVRKNYPRHFKAKLQIPREIKKKLKTNPFLINSPRYSKYNLKKINKNKALIKNNLSLKNFLSRYK